MSMSFSTLQAIWVIIGAEDAPTADAPLDAEGGVDTVGAGIAEDPLDEFSDAASVSGNNIEKLCVLMCFFSSDTLSKLDAHFLQLNFLVSCVISCLFLK